MISRRISMGRTTDVGTTGAFHFLSPPLLRTSIGDTRSSHGRRWYNCTWLSADARRAPAARHLAASFHSSGTFHARITSVGVQLSTGSERPSLFVAVQVLVSTLCVFFAQGVRVTIHFPVRSTCLCERHLKIMSF